MVYPTNWKSSTLLYAYLHAAKYASSHHDSWMVLEDFRQCQTMLNITSKQRLWLAACNVCSFKHSNTSQLSQLRSPLFLKHLFPEAAHQCLSWALYHLGCMPLFRPFLNSPIREASFPAQGWFPYPHFLPTQLSQPMTAVKLDLDHKKFPAETLFSSWQSSLTDSNRCCCSFFLDYSLEMGEQPIGQRECAFRQQSLEETDWVKALNEDLGSTTSELVSLDVLGRSWMTWSRVPDSFVPSEQQGNLHGLTVSSNFFLHDICQRDDSQTTDT